MSAALMSLMRDVPASPPQGPILSGLPAFLVVGGGGAAAFVVLSTLMAWATGGMAPWLVSSICYGALIVPVYLLHRRFSFRSDVSHWQSMPRYMAVQAMALVLAALFSHVIGGVLTVPTLPASMLVIVLTSGVNFMVLRHWAFSPMPRAVAAIA